MGKKIMQEDFAQMRKDAELMNRGSLNEQVKRDCKPERTFLPHKGLLQRNTKEVTMKKYHCSCCGIVYDPEDITEKTHLSVFGKHFHGCPNCGALKHDHSVCALPEADESHLLGFLSRSPKHSKHYQAAKLPANAKFSASTPVLTDTTVPSQILGKHMAPEGKCGMLVVLKGNLQLVWEDTGVIHDADPEHPVLIYPERYHHVQMDGPAEFRIDFYEIQRSGKHDVSAKCPGEKFLRKK